MTHTALSSSMLASAGWEDNILEITFAKGGSTYRYYNVPEEEFKNLVGSESPGKYFTASIKGKYQSLKVEAPAREMKGIDLYRKNDDADINWDDF